MSFTSLLFIFGFLPLSWLASCAWTKKTSVQNVILLLLSLLFYAWGSIQNLYILLILIVWNYCSGLQLEQTQDMPRKRRLIFWSSVLYNVAVLAFYKYIGFWFGSILPQTQNIHAPIGLSFYTFSILSYLADLYLNKCPAQKNVVAFGLYVSFFGKLTMGPISQYTDFEQYLKHRTISKDRFAHGMDLFLKGLVKKVFFADQLALVFAAMGNDSSFLGAWLLSLAYTFQLYYDFSGYSDMAIGIGYLFGFEIPKNFDHPYIAKSVQDFWRRWHISLSSWFRDYVYIPLGGNRVSKEKYIRNILIVWLLTGIWHGPNWTFVIWGLYYGLLLLGQKFLFQKWIDRLPAAVNIILTFLIANIGWVFFSSPTTMTAFSHLGNMLGIGISSFASENALFYLSSYWLIFVFAFLLCGTLYEKIEKKIFLLFSKQAVIGVGVFKICVFVMMVAYLVSSTAQTFLYNAF